MDFGENIIGVSHGWRRKRVDFDRDPDLDVDSGCRRGQHRSWQRLIASGC